MFLQGRSPSFTPCTPLGCMQLLERVGIEVAGKRAVVVGRSNIVGMPAAMLLNKRDATVTICHSKTPVRKPCSVQLCRCAHHLRPCPQCNGMIAGCRLYAALHCTGPYSQLFWRHRGLACHRPQNGACNKSSLRCASDGVSAVAQDMQSVVKGADIVIAATGKAGLITSSWLKEGAVLIDVGTNSVDDASKKSGYRLVGDADFESCSKVRAL